MTRSFLIPFLIVSAGFSGCAYHFQNSKSAFLQKEGIRRIYIAPLRNETYKAGVENLLYNELLQAISAGRRVEVVSNREAADAVLEGTVTTAEYVAGATTDSNALFPTLADKVITMKVAVDYTATVRCSFKLQRVKAPSREQKLKDEKSAIWAESFSRDHRFPGSNQRGAFGTTAPLINESEFNRALQEIAHEMMLDVHESMVSRF